MGKGQATASINLGKGQVELDGKRVIADESMMNAGWVAGRTDETLAD